MGKLNASPWAVKKINSRCATQQMAVYQKRLNAEAKLLKGINHPNIVGKTWNRPVVPVVGFFYTIKVKFKDTIILPCIWLHGRINVSLNFTFIVFLFVYRNAFKGHFILKQAVTVDHKSDRGLPTHTPTATALPLHSGHWIPYFLNFLNYETYREKLSC